MLAVNYSTARDNFKSFCDKAVNDAETIIVTRKDDKNIVIMSLKEYNNLMENQFIMSSKKNYDRLLASKKQIESGKAVPKTMKALEDAAK